MRKIEIEAKHLGFNKSGYAGAFSPNIQDLIKSLIYGRVLHLYSGISSIGDVRIDLERPEATHNISVEKWITSDENHWDWCILDPPYKMDKSELYKLKQYAERESVWGNQLIQAGLKKYFARHVDNILWLDYCAPIFKPFRRRKLWLMLPGGFHSVRVLSWLERESNLLL